MIAGLALAGCANGSDPEKVSPFEDAVGTAYLDNLGLTNVFYGYKEPIGYFARFQAQPRSFGNPVAYVALACDDPARPDVRHVIRTSNAVDMTGSFVKCKPGTLRIEVERMR